MASTDKKNVISSLIESGKAKGKLSTKDITDALEELDYDVEQVDKLYSMLEGQNIEIVEEGASLDGDLEKLDLDGDDAEDSLDLSQRSGDLIAALGPLIGLDDTSRDQLTQDFQGKTQRHTRFIRNAFGIHALTVLGQAVDDAHGVIRLQGDMHSDPPRHKVYYNGALFCTQYTLPGRICQERAG